STWMIQTMIQYQSVMKVMMAHNHLIQHAHLFMK
ncbi:hypothetical protein SEEN0624_08947, partial [Salmonella enterica subsp. enterica serovar Newport str. PRS_2010_0624]